MTDQTPGRRSRRPHRGRRVDEQTDTGPAQTPGAGRDRDRVGGFDASTARRWIGTSPAEESPASPVAPESPERSDSPDAGPSPAPAASPAPPITPAASASAPTPSAAQVPTAASAPSADESGGRRRGRRAGPPRDESAEALAARRYAAPTERQRARRARRGSYEEMDAWSAADSRVVSRDHGAVGESDAPQGEEPPTTVLPPLDTPRTAVRLGSSSVTALGPRDAEEQPVQPPRTASPGDDSVDDAAAPAEAPASSAVSPAPTGVAAEEQPATSASPESPATGSPAPAPGATESAAAEESAPAARDRDAARAPGRRRAAAVAGASAAAGAGASAPAARTTSGSAAAGSDGRAGSGSGSGGGSSAGGSDSGGGRGSRPDHEGSLPRAAGWTVLTSLIPGTGLLTTPLRRIGWVLLGLIIIAALGTGIWFLAGDPLLSLLKFLSSRRVLIALMVVIAVVGLVWILQVVLSNLAHNTRERLRGRRRAISLIVAVVMVIGVAIPFGRAEQYVFAAQGLLGNESVFRSHGNGGKLSSSDPWKGTERVNVLLLGQDEGADRTGTRPDTIMVASIDTKTGRTALFSIPRNLQYVRFPEGTVAQREFPDGFDAFGKGQNLINAVWTWAEDNKDDFPDDVQDPGLTATEWAVQETLGLDLDYYAMVNLQGFSDLVDAIGGVQLDVERKIPIGGGTNQSTGGKYPITGYIEPGTQNLKGDKALWYARSREGSSDFNRICRQQRMVRAVSEQANPTKLALNFTKLVGVAGSNIETDVPTDDLDAFVDLGWKVKDAGFASYPIQPGVDLPDRRHDTYFEGGHPDWDYLKEWVQESIDDSMTTTEADSVSEADGESATATEEPSESATTETTTAPETSESTESSESTTGSSSDASADADDEAEKQAEADPLSACMPGTQDPDAQPGD
jgi:LCP family protein required for cell wall assembly